MRNRYIYAAISEQEPLVSRMMRASGVVKLNVAALNEKLDQNDCTMASRMYESNCFGGESFFIARNPKNPNSEEDEGKMILIKLEIQTLYVSYDGWIYLCVYKRLIDALLWVLHAWIVLYGIGHV
ncbi:hypothetical protein R6Q57_011452 [Mikania cordata]